MSALGSGVTRDGQLVVSLGTSGTLFGVSGAPIVDATGAIAPFCDATGAWLPLVCTLNCTRAAEEAREAFGLSQEEATRLAAQEEAGCRGVNFIPYLAGERTPNWPNSSGAILGLRPGVTSPWFAGTESPACSPAREPDKVLRDAAAACEHPQMRPRCSAPVSA
jgi:xylulokinase